MLWFVIDPETGEYGERIAKPGHIRDDELYAPDGFFDGFFDVAWAFEWFLAPHPRPSFEDLETFVVDGYIPLSMLDRIGPEFDQHLIAIQDHWKALDIGEGGYQQFTGRPLKREEKRSLVKRWLQLLAVGREQFYAGKTVEHEEWLVAWHAWDVGQWRDDCWGRLRVFSDGTADAWCRGLGLMAYDTEEYARQELAAAKYSTWEHLDEHLFRGEVPPPPAPTEKQKDDTAEPFRYRKE